MAAPSIAAPLCALLGALLLGAVGASDCPAACSCNLAEDYKIDCELSRTNVTVEWRPDSQVNIKCTDDENFTFEEFPQIDVGPHPIRLELVSCALPPSFELAAARASARYIQELYIKEPLDDITADMVAGLERLERLAIFAGETHKTTALPTEVFARLPNLRAVIVNKANLTIRPDDFASAPALTYVELGMCNITRLPDAVFSPLNKLEKLYLWKNKIEELPAEQLEGLVSLQRLDIQSNLLRSLRGVAATHLPLQILYASSNPFDELPPLTNLTNLQQLKITSNLEQPLKIAPRALASLSYLKNVILSRNKIQHIPNDTFSNSPALKTLDLTNNDLGELSPGVFSDLTSLEQLELSHNRLRKLDENVFRSLQALQTLTLDFNQLTSLPPNGMNGLASLKRLSVSNNNLLSLTNSVLLGASALVHVDFSYNNISDPEPTNTAEYITFGQTFAQREPLREINLSHNRLTSLPQDVAATLIYLEKLDLSYNLIEELVSLSFASNNLTVDLRHNRVRRVLLWRAAAPDPAAAPAPAPAPRPRALVLLDDNPFLCDCLMYYFAQRLHNYKPLDTPEAQIEVGSAQCAGPPLLAGRRLRALELRDYACDLRDLARDLAPLPYACPRACRCAVRTHTRTLELTCETPPTTFPNTTELQKLLVNEIQLKLTETPALLNLTAEVTTLNLSGLALTYMPAGYLPPNLKILDISDNDFTVIPKSLLGKEFHLKAARNPLICDCWHADDVKLLQENKANIDDYAQVHCSNNVLLGQVNVSQLCSTWRASVIGGVLAAFGLLTVIAAILLLKYSFEIKVWLYARGMFSRWLVVDDDDRRYDAFISFCHRDEDFVSEYLLPGLENIPQPYKICIHYRDWMPGEFITTQIAQSVADSRRTVIVVSKNFLESQWARAEFRTANMSAIKERKTRVIVVLLEDVNSHKELDPELKAYLSTNTYLKWGDPWFWDKLKYALPHRRADTSVRREKAKVRARARAEEARKVVGACALDTRLTANGQIVNAAAVLPAPDKKCEQINLDIRRLDKIRTMADMKPIQV